MTAYAAYRDAMTATAYARGWMPATFEPPKLQRGRPKALSAPPEPPISRYRFIGMYAVPIPSRVLVSTILAKVADHYGISSEDMRSSRRETCLPRQVGMYLARKLTPKGYPEIAHLFGKGDHTTAIHAVRRVEKLRASDRELDADIRRLSMLLAPCVGRRG